MNWRKSASQPALAVLRHDESKARAREAGSVAEDVTRRADAGVVVVVG